MDIRDRNRADMEIQLRAMGATDRERFLATYVAYSESDFFNDRQQLMQDRKHYSRGLFQQTDLWWPNPLDIAVATRSFIQALRLIPDTGDPTIDAWQVQMWAVPNALKDLKGFFAAPETQNYTSRLGMIKTIVSDALYFTHHPDKFTQLV